MPKGGDILGLHKLQIMPLKSGWREYKNYTIEKFFQMSYISYFFDQN
jgi:hypothetical protein